MYDLHANRTISYTILGAPQNRRRFKPKSYEIVRFHDDFVSISYDLVTISYRIRTIS